MNCKRCSVEFKPVRVAQVYCSRKCRVADAVARHRSDYTKPDPTTGAEKRLQGVSDSSSALSDGSTVVWPTTYDLHGPTPGALRGATSNLNITRTASPSCRPVWTGGR